jgi:aspartate dehydrogenase
MSASETRGRRLRLCLVGWGAIANRTAELLAERQVAVDIVAIAVRDASRQRPDMPAGARVITAPQQLADFDVDMVIEAAGRASVAVWGEASLRHAGRFVVSSTSAFCDDALLAELLDVARATGGQIIVPPGALGGMDALAAASVLPIDEVVHTIVKPPRAWRGTRAEQSLDLEALSERTVFFSGTAREAADGFPQNANVAVISALAGIGLDRTRVELVADPGVSRNGHHIRASGAFGRMDMLFENEPLKTNPKSSEMTALNLVRLVQNHVAPLVR